ncbi:NADPH-dependent F420 reductase [Myxosarcina sp. GI1(2024)]
MSGSQILLYTIRGINPAEVLTSLDVLADKIIIDCNNYDIPEDFDYQPIEYSLAEKLASEVPQAHIVKAFNTFAQEVFELAPSPLKDLNVSCFVAGDNKAACQKVMQLAEEIGFTPIDSGQLRNARMLEKMADFIRYMIIGQNLGSLAILSLQILPAAQTQRLGGRKISNL